MKLGALLPAAGSVSMPLLLGSLGASALGGFMSNREKQQAIERRNEATAEIDAQARERDELLAAEARQALDQLVLQHGADQRKADITDAVDARTQAISPDEDIVLPTLPGIERAGEIVQSSAAANMSEAMKEARARLAALAGLSGYGAHEAFLGRELRDTAMDNATLAGLRQGSLRAAEDAKRYHQLELESFQPSPLSSLISGAGQLGAFAAGTGVGASGAGANAATAAAARPSYYGMSFEPATRVF